MSALTPAPVPAPIPDPIPASISAVHPVLAEPDVPAAIRFYRSLGFALAWQDDETAPRYAVIRRDEVELHLQWADAGQFSYPVDRPAYRFRVGDVDALFAEFQRNGVALASASPYATPHETPWHTQEFHLRDPGGNVLQFYRLL